MRHRELLNWRSREAGKALAMFFYLFAGVGAFVIGRISRDALLLEVANGQALLPYLYVGGSLAVCVTILAYSRLNRGTAREQVAGRALAIFVVTCLGCRALMELGGGYYTVYYVWVEVAGAVMMIQCWSLAGDIFTSREAKRTFAFVGGGGVVASILCGFAVNGLVPLVGTRNLLFLVALLIAGALVLQRLLVRIAAPELNELRGRETRGPRDETAPSGSRAVVPRTLGSRHLKVIAAIVMVTYFVVSIVDYQFKVMAASAITDTDQRASFFGLFFGVAGALSAVVQFGLTGRVLERMGVFVALLVLPAAMLLGSVVLLFVPGLLVIGWVRGSEAVLRYTINDATMQLVYVPVPSAQRRRAKQLIDGILKPCAIGAAGLVLLLASRLAVHQLAILTSVCLVGWIGLLLALKREYVKTLMLTLRKRRLNPAESILTVSDESTVQVLLRALQSQHEGQVLHALDLLQQVRRKPRRIHEAVLALLEHPTVSIRLAALTFLRRYADSEDVRAITDYFNDDSEVIRAQAIATVAAIAGKDSIASLKPFQNDQSPRVRAAAIASLIRHSGLDGAPKT